MDAGQIEVLMVGSVPLSSTKDVFKKLAEFLPSQLRTMPDGETGERDYYVRWQFTKFPRDALIARLGGPSEEPKNSGQYTLDMISPTGYDDVAIESYATFRKLRERGVISPHVRFQISVPTPLNVIQFGCRQSLKSEIEPLYAERLYQSIERIAKHIPRNDLVIQLDMPAETLLLERDRGRAIASITEPHFSPTKEGIFKRLAQLLQHIPQNINIAIHLCYGDIGHKHHIEPESTGLMVEFANEMLPTFQKTHKVEWIHMPVPRDRDDAEYFEPLRQLRLGDTRLVLGLVRENDEEGTMRRLRVARSVCPHPFGIATECGLGRTPKDDVESVLTICRNASISNRDQQ